MQYQNLAEVVSHANELALSIRETEPEEIKALRTGNLDNQAGTNGQYFGTWEIAAGMLRDYSMYTLYPLVHIVENEDISLDHFKFVLETFDHPYSNYLRYSGFPTMGALAMGLRQHLLSAETRQEAVEAIRAFLGYTNQLAAWSFHYFPWGLGKHFTYDGGTPVPESIADLSRRVQIRNGAKVRLTWQPLGVSVDAVLASEENPELCADLIKALPFTIIQDHAVVSGKSMYAWTPLVSTAPVHVKERQCDAPIGRIRFSQGTGQKIIVQYGEVTEDIATPVLGEVIPEHAGRLPAVGEAVWASTFDTKAPIWLTVELI